MDEKRLRRYIDKLNHLDERIEDVYAWIDEVFEDKKTKLAVYKAVQEAVESAADVVAMFLKDSGVPPKDDYTNIEKWIEIVGERETGECLKIANGLRNRLVHHYNGINDKIAVESIKDVLPCLEKFGKVMKDWLKKNA